MKKRLFCAAAAFFACAAVFCQVQIPVLTSPVMDTANVMNAETKYSLENYLLSVWEETGVQTVVYTLPTTEGESIEEFAGRVFEQWKPGQADKDNGVLLVVAVQDRNLRIEVGYGLEAALTDTRCGLIIRKFITPHFSAGDFSKGIYEGAKLIADYAAKDENAVIKVESSENSSLSVSNFIIPIIMVLFFVIVVVTNEAGVGVFGYLYWISLFTGKPFVRRKPKRSKNSSSRMKSILDHIDDNGGFGGFGGFGGGGGFSGGGGSSGGGGASGKW